MLTAERAFVFLDQQSGLIGHLTELALTFRLLDVDDRTKMQFTSADMGMIDAAQTEVSKHLGEVGHVGRQLLRRHRCVFDDANGLGIAFHAGEQAQTRLAQAPHLADFSAIDPRTGINQMFLVFD